MSPEPSSSKIGKSVGEKLRAARVAQHYTQSQLAAPDFSVSYISAIERGQIHPSLRALEILAGRLGLSSTQLLPARAQQDDRPGASAGLTERDDDEVGLTFLEIEISIRQDAAAEAAAQLEKLSTKRLKKPQLLQHHYLLGWAYFKAAQFQECDYILSEAIQLAKELDSHYLHLRILNLQAMAYAAMRNYAQALLAHQRCLNLLETVEPEDPFFKAQVYMYMGQHYTQLGNLNQALEMYNKALALTEELAAPQEVQALYRHTSEYYASTKDYELATLYVYKSSHLYEREMSKRLKSTLYYYLGRAIIKGDQEQAHTYLNEALQKEQAQRDPLVLASIYARYAEWHFKRQELPEAERYAWLAYKQAQPLGETIIGANALITLGHIEYAQQCYKDGDQHLVAGLEMLEYLDSHEELADESVRYAELLEKSGKVREAFTYFRQAFQYQQKSGT